MTNLNTSDVQAAVDAGRHASHPHELEAGRYYVVSGPDGVTKVDLTDLLLVQPRRTSRSVTVADTESFLAYWTKHSTPASELFADRAELHLHAVVDAPTRDTPDWMVHRLTMQLRHSPAWSAWTRADRTWMGQEAFAEHLEDRLGDIVDPAGAEMLEVAQTLHATTKVRFKSGFRLVDGQRQISYQEETAGNAGANGQLSIPQAFTLGLPIFAGAPVADPVRARLRYRVSDGGLRLSFALDRATELVDDAFGALVHQVADQAGRPVFRR